jgi:hypothetical protein
MLRRESVGLAGNPRFGPVNDQELMNCRIEAIRKSGGRLNEFAIPEMVDYLRRIGYQVGSFTFARLSCHWMYEAVAVLRNRPCRFERVQ